MALEPSADSAITGITSSDTQPFTERSEGDWANFIQKLDQDLGNIHTDPGEDDQRLREEIYGLREIMRAYRERTSPILPISQRYQERISKHSGGSEGDEIFWLGVDFQDEAIPVSVDALPLPKFGGIVCATIEQTIFSDGMMNPQVGQIMKDIRAFQGVQ